MDMVPPDIFSDDPEELVALASIGSRFKRLDKKVLHDCVRLLTGSAADFLDDYFESDILKGYLASSSIIGTKVGPCSQGSGLVLLYHFIGEHDGVFGAWAFHKKGNGGFTQVLAAGGAVVRGGDRLESPVAAVITRDGQVTGVALDRRVASIHAPIVVSALDPRRTFLELVDPRELPSDLVDAIERFRFQGTSAKVNFALDGPPPFPALRRSDRPVPRVHEHRAVDGLPREGVRRGEIRLVLVAAVPRLRDPVDDRPGHGATRQARHVVVRAVRAVPPARVRLGQRAAEPGRHGAAHAGVVLPRVLGDLVLHREVVTPLDIERVGRPVRGEHLHGRVLRPADVLLPAGAGLVAVPDADRGLLPVRLGDAPRAAA